MIEILQRLGSIGDRPDDSDEERLKHRFLIYMGAAMSVGGIVWGSLAATFGLFLPAVIPYGYVVLTVVNLGILSFTRDFGRARLVQVFISLLLPFLFQWSLGGFVASGAVMLWAMLALAGTHAFSDSASTLKWLGIYCALTLVSGLIDPYVREQFSSNPPENIQVLFAVVNIVMISICVFGLTVYLMAGRDRLRDELEEANRLVTSLNERLESDVAARTRELASALAERQAILDNLVDGLVAVDHEGFVRVTNPALAAMYSLSGNAEDTQTRPATDLPTALADMVSEARTTRKVVTREMPLPGERLAKVSASPVTGADGGDHGAVALVRDITLEKEIDRMKTDFIATVSHELRTPLTSVLGFAKITKNKLEEQVFQHVPADDKKAQRAVAQVKGNVDIIVSEGERLTHLINDVLDISKMEAGRMEWKMGPVQVDKLVARAVDAVASLFPEDGPALRTEVAPDLPEIEGDFDRLLQVIINLLSNAAKFTEKGSVTVSAKRTGEGIEISVTDTGPGIDPALHEAVFEKFKQVGDTLTNKPKGTGLGLPICRQIVRAHHGRIWVEGRPGVGSRFAFVVPANGSTVGGTGHRVDSLVRKIEKQVKRGDAPVGADILVVDDDANLRELLQQQLGERGYRVRMASNGYEAIGQVRAKRPDLVILDVMMPELSGFDVAAMLKGDPSTESIPILVLSIIQDSDRGVRLGVDRYLAKPADGEVLASTVKELLEEVRSPRKVLVVDERAETSSDIARLLEAKGYTVVGTCKGEDCLDQARRTKPDLIIVESIAQGHDELIRTIRYEKELQHIYVVQLVDDKAKEPVGGA
jgi:signal transduction histidine kinase/CheY-like chemotaxis protein